MKKFDDVTFRIIYREVDSDVEEMYEYGASDYDDFRADFVHMVQDEGSEYSYILAQTIDACGAVVDEEAYRN